MSLPHYKEYVQPRKLLAPQIPAHWPEMMLKRILSVKSGDFLSAEQLEPDGVPVFGGNGPRGYYREANTKANTLLIGRVGALCGNVHLVDRDVWATEHALRVIFRRKANPKYFYYLLTNLDLNKFAIRTAQPLINSTIVEEQFVAVPPLNEQNNISTFLDRETSKLDRLVEQIAGHDWRETIDSRTVGGMLGSIFERRSALVAAAVSGQFEVPAAPTLVEAA